MFNGTLEPAFGLVLEGASFITSYSREQAHKVVAQLKPGTTTLDEASARMIAGREGINVIITGSVAAEGRGYKLRCKAEDAVTGKVLSKLKGRAREWNSPRPREFRTGPAQWQSD